LRERVRTRFQHLAGHDEGEEDWDEDDDEGS